jgi:hypothetical protein
MPQTRRKSRQPRRLEPRWKARLALAGTPYARFRVADGRLTAALSRLCRTGRTDAAAEVRDTALAGRLADEAFECLMRIAERAEGGDPE